jgi:hypothetical protein
MGGDWNLAASLQPFKKGPFSLDRYSRWTVLEPSHNVSHKRIIGATFQP